MTKMRIEHHAVPQLTNGRLVLAAILLLGRFFLISGQSISDERCNICGCNLNECTFGQSVATLQFDYQGQPYRQNCFWLNDQINRPNSPFDLDWCKNELPPIVLEKCACFYLTTGEDVPIPAGSTTSPATTAPVSAPISREPTSSPTPVESPSSTEPSLSPSTEAPSSSPNLRRGGKKDQNEDTQKGKKKNSKKAVSSSSKGKGGSSSGKK